MKAAAGAFQEAGRAAVDIPAVAEDIPAAVADFRAAVVSPVDVAAAASPGQEGVAVAIRVAALKEEAGREGPEDVAGRCGNPWRSP